MTDFSIVGIWANAQISAADQAKFFFEMDSLIPREFVGYARYLLSTIAGYESWGIPAVARPRGYTVFFKGGWRGTGLGQLVHQVGPARGPRPALLDRGDDRRRPVDGLRDRHDPGRHRVAAVVVVSGGPGGGRGGWRVGAVTGSAERPVA